MADKTMDREDEILQSLFADEPIADNGFSKRVVRRIAFGIWVNRLALPVAAAIGFLFAAGPLVDVFGLLPSLAAMMPEIKGLSGLEMPQAPVVDGKMILYGGLVLVAGLFVTQVVED